MRFPDVAGTVYAGHATHFKHTSKVPVNLLGTFPGRMIGTYTVDWDLSIPR